METTLMSLEIDAEKGIFEIISMDVNDKSKHELINDLLHDFRNKCMEYFSTNPTPEQLAAERDEDKIRFIERNFAAVYAQHVEDNRVLGYDASNGFIIRDWQALVRDAVASLDYAFEKIHLPLDNTE